MRLLQLLFLGFVFTTVCSCGPDKYYPDAENALDAGREFIDACLKGDFDKASFYMLQDSANLELLKKQENNYKEKSAEEKKQYHDASIIINEDATLSDSIHIINYKNSYDKLGRKVRVVFSNKHWLVDFKYTFNGNL